MPEYIDREKAIEYVMSRSPFINGMTSSVCIERAIKNVPIADVVQVVRCKDCKYRNTHDCKMWYQCVICGDYHHWERDDYFCSYGERKE